MRITAVAWKLTAATAGLVLLAGAPAAHGAAKRPLRIDWRYTSTCSTPAPDTPAGYAAMLNNTASPNSVWGAADLSISVPLPDGRDVWLYGDTFESTGAFPHSTALVQDRGCLHVSNNGAQLLPNDDPQHIYWIASARQAWRVGPNAINVTATAITLTGTGVWDFQYAGHMRTARVTINSEGDATFRFWVSDVVEPMPDPGPLFACETPQLPYHYCYSKHTHPEAHLADGKTLVTMCQGWTDGLHPVADYRPLYSEQ